MPLTPYTGPFGKPELLHLLRRTLFGVTVADLNHFTGMTLTQVVNELLTYTNNTTPPLKTYWVDDALGNPDPSLVDPNVPWGTTWVTIPRDPLTSNQATFRRRRSFERWWVGNLLNQERNLREKMVLFWQNLLVTESQVISLPEAAYTLNQLLRDNSLGNFRQLMFDVTIDAGMLRYLNGYLNVAVAPDENYARELMELFTLGEGSGYTEDDVQAAARVLTGWKVRQTDINLNLVIPFVEFNPVQHDTNDKQFSPFFNNTVVVGQSGPNAGADELNALLDMIFDKEEVSKHLCRELYRFFVHSEIDANVESNVIESLALTFRNNIGAPNQMEIVMQELLSSQVFFDQNIRACMVRSPLDFIIGNLRLFKQPWPDPNTQFEAMYHMWGQVNDLAAYSGQEIANPPNVAGWPAYYQFPQYDQLWLDTATYAVRKLIYEAITAVGFSTGNNFYDTASQQLDMIIDGVSIVQDLNDPADPDALIQELTDLMFAVPISSSVRDQLKQNYLLFGQTVNYYWTNAYNEYVTNPGTTDPAAQLVPLILLGLLIDLQGAAEHHLM